LQGGVRIMPIDENLELGGGIIKLITDHKVKTFYGEYKTLKECLELGKGLSEMPTSNVIVMHEEALRGDVYRYGNHGAFWEHIGTTKGFA